MGSALFELAVVVLVAWFVWRLIAARLKLPGQPTEPGRDDFAGVPARLRPRPKAGAGAVALDVPDDEGDAEAAGPESLPRRLGR